ncbi:hypothetical protein [Altererythrobacter lutimaris]|uniref:Uncharacterized protein n=1 Tax=Altererythrobacter lutimaris TaxID=2743979 RepID=A0A850HAG2_9SPHN|nr:hypothetical protein [Altererythrobacter lutimaris]NVE93951.1 hypothetical protein [Altererythrobacter lutimaris]
MTFFAVLIGAGIFLLVLLGVASFAPRFMKNDKASAPDPGAGSAGGGTYGSKGFDEYLDFDAGCGGDGD